MKRKNIKMLLNIDFIHFVNKLRDISEMFEKNLESGLNYILKYTKYWWILHSQMSLRSEQINQHRFVHELSCTYTKTEMRYIKNLFIFLQFKSGII